MESSTKTIAKRARVGPRTEIVSTMENILEVSIFWKFLVISEIVSENISGLRLELLKRKKYGRNFKVLFGTSRYQDLSVFKHFENSETA